MRLDYLNSELRELEGILKPFKSLGMFSIAVTFPPKITGLGSRWSKGNLTTHRNWRQDNASREEQLYFCLSNNPTNRFWYEFWRHKENEYMHL